MPSASQVSGIADDALKSELRKTWENAAPGWAKWEHVFSAGLSDATDTLIDMAGIQPGMRVLDLACGAGSQTIQTAKRVGPTGNIVASDISATMLESVRQSAAAGACKTLKLLNARQTNLMRRYRHSTRRSADWASCFFHHQARL